MDAAVEVTELVKRYPGRPVDAVSGVSFTVDRGEVFGLLGPNGAGKTTTVGVLTTRVLPTGGSAAGAGLGVVGDGGAGRKRVPAVAQAVHLESSLLVRVQLVLHAP